MQGHQNSPSHSSTPSSPARPLLDLVGRYPLTGFVLWSLLASLSVALMVRASGGFDQLVDNPLLIAGVGLTVLLGPTLGAVAITAATEGATGVRAFVRRCVRWRVPLRWYLIPVAGLPGLAIVVALIKSGGVTSFQLPTLAFGAVYLATFVMVCAIGGPLAEEPGWRGFALPRLQRRFGALAGTVVLGILWALCHLPFYVFLPGYNYAPPSALGTAAYFGLFMITVLGGSILLTWLFNASGGSVIPPLLLHTTVNTIHVWPDELFPDAGVHYGMFLLITLPALALLIVAGTRGRLGNRS